MTLGIFQTNSQEQRAREDAHPEDDKRLVDAGILYAPDYVINAGGVIDVYYQVTKQSVEAARQHIMSIDDTLDEIFDRALATGRPTQEIADEIARVRFEAARQSA